MRRMKLLANPKVALVVIAVHVALLGALLWFGARKPGGPEAPKHVILQTVTLPPLKPAEPAAPELQLPSKPTKPPPAEPAGKPLPKPVPGKSSRLGVLPSPATSDDAAAEASLPPATTEVSAAAVAHVAVAVAAVAAPPVTAAAPARDIDAPEPLAARPDHERCPHAGYPLPLRERGIEGTVWLRVQVTTDGLPAAVSVLRGSGWRLFDEAALQAARACRFIPARRGVERLASWVEFPMRFALDS